MAASRNDSGPAAAASPIHNRSCTDILCLLLWLAFVAGWAAVAVFVFYHGDPDLLLHPTNSAGEPCGASGTQVENRTYLSYFDMTRCGAMKDSIVGCGTPQVCVTKCPTETYNFTGEDCSLDIRKRYVCRIDINPEDSIYANGDNCKDLLDDKQCAIVALKSVPMLDRCIPNIPDEDISDNHLVKDYKGNETSILVDDLKSGASKAGSFTRLQELGAGAFSDLQNTWWVIVVACVTSALLSLLWIFLMRFITTILIWTAFVGMLGATIYGCVVTYLRYDQVKATSGNEASFNPLDAFTQGFGSLLDQPTVWLVFFIALCIVAVLLLLLLLVLYKRIRVATAMISQASRAVNSALSTLFFPLVPFVLQLGVVALFLGVALYTASMGDPKYEVVTPEDCVCPDYKGGETCKPNDFNGACDSNADCVSDCAFAGYEPHPAAVYLQIYNVFALFWGLFFCSALGELILAGAFASWYWTFDKKHDLPSLPVLSSAGRAVRYHLGTVAFGSLIIALIRMARATLEYIQRQTKGVDNPLARGVICCCKCCLWCFEKFMRFINRNAYIVCAIYGTNFCASAKDAFSLLLRNILRVVVVNSACEVMLLMGKLVVTALVTIASFYFMEDRIPIEGLDRYVPTTQHSWVPLITVAIASFFVCSVFFSVYTMAVDTIFLCFLEDIERNNGSPEKPYYMSKSLMKLLGKKNKEDQSRDLKE